MGTLREVSLLRGDSSNTRCGGWGGSGVKEIGGKVGGSLRSWREKGSSEDPGCVLPVPTTNHRQRSPLYLEAAPRALPEVFLIGFSFSSRSSIKSKRVRYQECPLPLITSKVRSLV